MKQGSVKYVVAALLGILVAIATVGFPETPNPVVVEPLSIEAFSRD